MLFVGGGFGVRLCYGKGSLGGRLNARGRVSVSVCVAGAVGTGTLHRGAAYFLRVTTRSRTLAIFNLLLRANKLG